MIKSLHRIKLETLLYFILLVVIGFWFFVLNWNTPFMHDDLAYHFFYDSNSAIERPTSEPITSFWQIFPSMWNHYNAVNGRFTSHFIIQLFCGLIGKGVFNIFNTFIFILFCDLSVILSAGTRKLLPLTIVIASVMFLLPFPGQTMLWLTGSVNYLWSATFSLIILWLLQNAGNRSFIVTLLLFFFAIFAGWMNESISFGIGGGLIIYFFIHRERFVGRTRWMVLGYLTGCLLILLSPGTMNRAASGEINTELTVLQMVSSRLIDSVFLLKGLPIISIAFLILILACFKRFRFLVNDGTLFILSFLVTALFCFLLGLTDHRIFFGLAVLGMMIIVFAVCSYSDHYDVNRTICDIVVILILLLCLPQGTNAINNAKEYNVYSADVEQRILSSPPKCVIKAMPVASSRFVYATTVDSNRYQGHNRIRAFYYNKEYVQALPDNYMGLITEDSTVFRDYPFWFYTGLDGRRVKTVVYNMMYDYSTLPRRQYFVRYLLGYLNSTMVQQRWIDFENDGVEYIAFPKTDYVERIDVYMKAGAKEVLIPSAGINHIHNSSLHE